MEGEENFDEDQVHEGSSATTLYNPKRRLRKKENKENIRNGKF